MVQLIEVISVPEREGDVEVGGAVEVHVETGHTEGQVSQTEH